MSAAYYSNDAGRKEPPKEKCSKCDKEKPEGTYTSSGKTPFADLYK